MKKATAGVLLLVFATAVVLVYFLFAGNGNSGGSDSGSNSPIVVRGYAGGEKSNFLSDPDVLKILKDKYGITLDDRKAGSIEMVRICSSRHRTTIYGPRTR